MGKFDIRTHVFELGKLQVHLIGYEGGVLGVKNDTAFLFLGIDMDRAVLREKGGKGNAKRDEN